MSNANEYDLLQLKMKVLARHRKKRAAALARIALPKEDAKTIDRRLKSFDREVNKLARQSAKSKPARIEGLLRTICYSFNGRLAGVCVAAGSHVGFCKDNRKLYDSAQKLFDFADRIDLTKPSGRWVFLVPRRRPSGKLRHTYSFSTEDRAKHYLLRDCLVAAGSFGRRDLSIEGGNNETLRLRASQFVRDGYLFWTALDVENFYPSLGLEHLLPVLPVPRNIILGSVMLFPGNVRVPKDSPYHGRLFLDKSARLSLPQGAAVSSLAAGAVLERAMEARLSSNVVVLVWGDDISIGASTPEEALNAAKVLQRELENLPAGSICLRDTQQCALHRGVRYDDFIVRHARSGFKACGYFLRLAEDGELLRMQPTHKAYRELRRRIIRRLLAANASGEAAERIAWDAVKHFLAGYKLHRYEEDTDNVMYLAVVNWALEVVERIRYKRQKFDALQIV